MKVTYDSMCFACGVDNPKGLKLVFENRGGEARAEWTPGPEHVGWSGVIHGGLISTLLDEAMAYALIYSGVFGVTGQLSVRFRKPLHVGEKVAVTARVVEAKGRLIRAAGEVRRLSEASGWTDGRAADGAPVEGGPEGSRPGEVRGEIVAEAEATFVKVGNAEHDIAGDA